MRLLTPGTRLVVATHNPGKVVEINDLVRPFGLDAVSAGELGLPEPEETEATFAGNARLKAVAAAQASGLPSLSDDSGLEVDCLGGAPGIYSARWAGPSKDFSVAMKKVADEEFLEKKYEIAKIIFTAAAVMYVEKTGKIGGSLFKNRSFYKDYLKPAINDYL